MPMQLAEACMSAEFINLHLLWAVGEGRRWKSRLGEREEEGKQHACRLCSEQTGRTWRRKETIREKRRKKSRDTPKNMYKYNFLSFPCWILPDDYFPPWFTFPLRAGSLLPLLPLPWACSKAARGLNPISTQPLALQHSYQRLALDSPLWSEFRPLMNGSDGDKRWWHSARWSRTRWWSLEFLMKWIGFYFLSPYF